MKIKNSYVYIKEARFHAFHGVMPQEQQVGGDFLVSVKAEIDVTQAVLHDMVEVTLNYAELYHVVKFEMEHPSMLLEHVAGRIGEAVFDTFPQVCAVDIRLTKVNPPMGADCQGAGVELHLINDKTRP